jgi:RND family efflux transporter MFP subunit
MNARRQLLLSAAVVGVALGTVGLYAALASPDAAPETAEGHDHATMAAGGGEGAKSVQLDADAARRIGVTYAIATLKPLQREVRTIGSVTYDETRLVNFNPKIEGWIERLHVDFTGAAVQEGQPLMDVYSPMLVSAQEELILARRLLDESSAGGSERARASAVELLEASRRRLRYWDVSAAEIARIEQTGTPRRTLTLRSPASGIVVEKSAIEGSRIMPGMDLFRIADLSRVWIDGEVFEKDLSLVRIGQHADVTFEAYPGEVFDALVSYVYPIVSLDSRTGKVRLELANPGLRLKPGMYAQVALHSAAARQALVVPRAAVHYTGTRSLVFVRHGETLMPHEVTTGHVAGSEIEILAGIDPGMQVVSSANFLIDSESNMGTSMTTTPGIDLDGPGGGAGAAGDADGQAPAPANPHAGH